MKRCNCFHTIQYNRSIQSWRVKVKKGLVVERIGTLKWPWYNLPIQKSDLEIDDSIGRFNINRNRFRKIELISEDFSIGHLPRPFPSLLTSQNEFI
jgi:hypothetical protein